jgi:hypothetical protein
VVISKPWSLCTRIISEKCISQASEGAGRVEQRRPLDGVPGVDFLGFQFLLEPALLFRDLGGNRVGTVPNRSIALYSGRTSSGSHGSEVGGSISCRQRSEDGAVVPWCLLWTGKKGRVLNPFLPIGVPAAGGAKSAVASEEAHIDA